MKKNNSRFVILPLISIALIFIYYWLIAETNLNYQNTGSSSKQQASNNMDNKMAESDSNAKGKNDNKKKIDQCMKLFIKLSSPNTNLIFRPPLKQPPPELMPNFTDNGKMPIIKQYYFDDAYSDSDAAKADKVNQIITIGDVAKLRKLVKEKVPMSSYDDTVMNKKLFAYKSEVSGKSIAVIGTISPWIEAIAYEVGAAKITTLDYTRKIYEDSRLEWIHVNDYLEEIIKSGQFEEFDNIASFSSIEHSGLGRYGDPLSPYGDLDAVKQVNCMLKPGGLFFLGLPVSSDGSSYIEYNAHRIYGTYRLNLLFKGWQLLESELGGANHRVFVLKKPSHE
jgi:hypothetical protein